MSSAISQFQKAQRDTGFPRPTEALLAEFRQCLQPLTDALDELSRAGVRMRREGDPSPPAPNESVHFLIERGRLVFVLDYGLGTSAWVEWHVQWRVEKGKMADHFVTFARHTSFPRRTFTLTDIDGLKEAMIEYVAKMSEPLEGIPQ